MNLRLFLVLPLLAVALSSPLWAQGARKAPPPAAASTPDRSPENIWYLDLSSGGRVGILLRPDLAPESVERIRTLTRQGFYNGLIFHRVIDGFMAQGGDPQGTGQGGSPLPDLKAEFNDAPHMRGTVAMARAQADDSANSQFYIMFQPVFRLDHHYTVVGRVISGMQWVDAIHRGEPPAEPTKILQASIAADDKAPPDFSQLADKAGDDVLAAEAAKLLAPAAGTPAPGAPASGAAVEGPAAPASTSAATPAPAPSPAPPASEHGN